MLYSCLLPVAVLLSPCQEPAKSRCHGALSPTSPEPCAKTTSETPQPCPFAGVTLSWWDSVSLSLWEGCDQKTPVKSCFFPFFPFFFLIFIPFLSEVCWAVQHRSHPGLISVRSYFSKLHFAAAFSPWLHFSALVLAQGNSACVPWASPLLLFNVVE